ncbi:HAD family hydrolase [Inquilinus limosus]|uniref:Phosphoglycolate phosphatase n=1 Tax=Inquilinus limosus MP06 TaxID=1398085 RepID=A0A0A0D9G3_9PROT|nr:HAD family hydrolase [Inquilinus limosus]KGM34493.1 phosphoglycolate phosphatase [Inquilinus limosus MP06]
MLLPRAILFDLDETLISAYGRPEAAWLAVSAEFSEALAPWSSAEIAAAVAAFARGFWADAERHRIWRQQIGEARRVIVTGAFETLAAAGRPVPAPNILHRLADRFTAYRDEQMRLFPDAHAVIDGFRARGVRLALVTNGSAEIQRAKITRFDLAHRFDHIQIEGEHGFGKPEERAYRHALQALGVAPADAWMVGDNLEWEVSAPQRLGIHAIWVDGTGDGLPAGSAIRPDRIIRAVAELLLETPAGTAA